MRNCIAEMLSLICNPKDLFATSSWAELEPKVLYLICKSVSSFEDLVAFGGVCSTWRKVALKQNFGQPLLPLPMLMLAENKHDDLREFYSLSEAKSYFFNVPDLRGKMCMETKGWIVTASRKGEMALVHPLTRAEVKLPHQNTSKYYYKHPMDPLIFVQRAVLSSPPDPKNEKDCVLMILHGGLGDVGFCRPGDKVWTVVEKYNFFNCGIQSLEYYRGKFYVLNNLGEVWEYDVIGKSKDIKPVPPRKIKLNIFNHLICKQSYLVASESSLLVVFRDGIESMDYGSTEFRVFEIDVEHGGYKEVTSLGSTAIFVGHSASLSIDTIWHPGLFPNSIYFTDDCIEAYLSKPEGGGMNMGIYSLEDKSVRPPYNGKSLSRVCPPVWTFLTIR